MRRLVMYWCGQRPDEVGRVGVQGIGRFPERH
jgi:hypothetical protein